VLTVAAQAPTVTIAQPPTGASYLTGDAITLQASAHDSAGVDLSTHVAWSSNLAGPLGTGAVVTTSLGQGTHTLTATVTDRQDLGPRRRPRYRRQHHAPAERGHAPADGDGGGPGRAHRHGDGHRAGRGRGDARVPGRGRRRGRRGAADDELRDEPDARRRR